jgi:tetratricopeptide (TPR) repeat protein
MAKISCRVTLVVVVGLFVPVATSCYGVPGYADAKLLQAAQAGEHGDLSACIKTATEVVDHCPSHALAYTIRGTAHRKSGEYAKAIADLDRAIELNPKLADAYTQRAYAYNQRKLDVSSQQILDDLNRSIELDSSSALAYILRGTARKALNDHDAAICDFNHALHLNPRSSTALAHRAMSKISIGKLDEARRDIRKALDLNPPAEERQQIEELLQTVKSREP